MLARLGAAVTGAGVEHGGRGRVPLKIPACPPPPYPPLPSQAGTRKGRSGAQEGAGQWGPG